MSSDSDSSFDLLDSDASSDFSMESFDVKVGELESFDSSFEDAIPKASDVKMTSESLCGDVVTSQDATIESPKPQMPKAFEITLSPESLSGDVVTGLEGSDATTEVWQNQVTTGFRNRIVFDIIKAVIPDRTVLTDDCYHQFVSDFFLREKNYFEKAKNPKGTIMTQHVEDVKQPKIGEVGEFSAINFWNNLALRKEYKDTLVELITKIYPDFPSELCETFATIQENIHCQLAISYGDYHFKMSKEINNIRKGVSEREARERFIERLTAQLQTQPLNLRCMQITAILQEFANSKIMNGPVEIYKELAEIAVEIEQKIWWFAIGLEAKSEPDVQKPLPILEEIEGTWKQMARYSIEEGVVRPIGFNDYGLGYRMKFNVQDSRVETSQFLPSGALESQWTALIVPKNSRNSDETRPHEFVEDNQWYTVNASDSWCRKSVLGGQLLIEFFYYHMYFANVYVRVQDDVANTEASTEVPIPQKTSVDTQTTKQPLEEVSSESESPKIPSSSESTQEATPEEENPTSVPILEEINGTWEIIDIENFQEYKETTGLGSGRLGDRLKINAQDSTFEISLYASRGLLNKSRTALLAPKNPWPSTTTYFHDYIDNNQWYTVRESKKWSRKMIQDGLLRIEHHYGPVFSTCVYKKIQDDMPPTPQLASDPAHSAPLFLIIIITAVITFLLTKLFFF